MERYFLEPYRFIAPFRSTFWVRLSRGMILRNLRKKQNIIRFACTGKEHLRASLDAKAGILLTPNHSRWPDPMVVGTVLSQQFDEYPYYVASYHLFRKSKFTRWMLNRLGGYSIYREGADREAIRATSQLLADGQRPVVLFPEGTWFRQNDLVGPLQDGLSLITRQAARLSERPIVIHPVAVKYWLLEDIGSTILARLAAIERRIGWHAQSSLDVLERIAKLGGALLALKEIEFLGHTQSGDLDVRIRDLTLSQVERLERAHLGRPFDGWALERIRRLRQHLTRLLLEKASDPATTRSVKKDLGDLLFCENLSAQSLAYVRERPSQERLAETIQRIEESLTDGEEKPLGKMGVTMRFGPAIDVRTFRPPEAADRKGGDALVAHLRATMQALLDQQLAEGPPAEWGCPLIGTTPSHVNGQFVGRKDATG